MFTVFSSEPFVHYLCKTSEQTCKYLTTAKIGSCDTASMAELAVRASIRASGTQMWRGTIHTVYSRPWRRLLATLMFTLLHALLADMHLYVEFFTTL